MSMIDATTLAEMARDQLISEGCSLTRVIGSDNVEDLRLFRQTLEKLIEQENARLSKSYSGPPEDYSGWWLDDVVARQLRYSVVAASLEVAAHHVSQVCEDVAVILRKDHPDLKRAVLTTAREFLKKARFCTPVPDDWEKMQDLYRLRNTIVHSLAAVPDEKSASLAKRLSNFLPGMTESCGSIELTASSTAYIVEFLSEFVSDLHKGLQTLCRQVQASQADQADRPPSTH